ncbi:MAG: hypothetical protein LH609_04155 [Rudanella sp.]|nr:hypothetical protein [Rudanella sp.]
MYRRLYLTLVCLLVGLIPTILFGQSSDKNALPPTRKLIDERSIDYLDFRALRFHLHNAVEHYNHQSEANANIARTLKTQADSLSQLRTQLKAQTTQIQQLKQVNRQYEKQSAGQKSVIDSVHRLTARLNYEHQLISDPRVLRIYKLPLADVRKVLADNIAKADDRFSYEGSPTATMLTIKRQFDKKTDKWWSFDKDTDSVLEITLRLLEHQYDAQRTVLYVDARLQQKDRSSDKPYEEQLEPEKTLLYRERALQLLEGFLHSMSEK